MQGILGVKAEWHEVCLGRLREKMEGRGSPAKLQGVEAILARREEREEEEVEDEEGEKKAA